MSLINKITSIETTATRHPDWFYHAFFPKYETYSSMFTEGIKCRRLIMKDTGERESYPGHNGYHYISLSKMGEINKHCSSFAYYKDKPAFIIDGITPRKCSYALENSWLERTRWPFRHSAFLDEYQAYKIIEPDKYVGLRCSVLEWYRENYKFYLRKLKDMILYMKEHNINLPIYDYTEVDDNNIYLINPDAYLELYSDIENELVKKR